jgi:DNA-binding CsgD family transcriptional regulator
MDKRRDLLAENEGKRLNLRLPLLICFAMYSAWQMGVVYFSGETLSIDGRAPLPVSIDDLTVLIAAGYMLSILVMIFLPRITVWTERITAITALLSALALYLPVSPGTLAMFYYLQCFCCLFMIGFETAIIVNLFSEKTTIKHLLVAYGLTNVFIAVLQNDFYKVTFPTFRLFTVVALALMLVFFFRLPANVWPRYVKKSDGFAAPVSLYTGVFILCALDCFATLFGIAVAESIRHGLLVIYISSAAFGLIIYILWKRYNITPLQSCSVLVAMTALGFVLAIASRFAPVLSLAACALLGAGVTCCWLNPFFGLLIAKRHPSRFIVPICIGIAFVTVLIHSALLDALRNNLTVLYVVYLVIAVSLVILYLILQPYLGYSFRGRTLRDIIGVVAEETEEEAAEAKIIPVNRAALLTKTETAESAAPVDVPLHERRMKILMTHALSPLTNREYQLADCIMRGLRRSEIAQEMGIEPESITKYSNRIYNKFAIHRRQDLFRLAEKLEREWPEE